jgi:predicted nucleic acid-binding protein
VVDATVILKWYLPEIYSDESRKLLDHFEIYTVDVAISQVATALWKRLKTGEVKAHQGKRIVANLVRLPIHFVAASLLANNAIELSSYSTRTFNECLYFVLALREQTKLVTADFSWYTMMSTGKLKGHVGFVNRMELDLEPEQHQPPLFSL